MEDLPARDELRILHFWLTELARRAGLSADALSEIAEITLGLDATLDAQLQRIERMDVTDEAVILLTERVEELEGRVSWLTDRLNAVINERDY